MNPSTSSSPPSEEPPRFETSAHLDDELEWEFAALRRQEDALPGSFAALDGQEHDDAASSDMSDGEDARFGAPAFRDAPVAFASGLDFALESFSETGFFAKDAAAPVFVLNKAPVASPQSPAAFSDEMPIKDEYSSHSFLRVNPSFSSRASPAKVMQALEAALSSFESCSFELQGKWTLRATWVCVAEEISFSVALSRPYLDASSVDVDFMLQVGEETKFVELAELVRGQCANVDAEAILFLPSSLEPWMDASQELAGRRYAINEAEAAALVADLNAELHVDSLYEVAKTVKDHCRHRGNRRLFLQSDVRSGFTRALRWMLSDREEVARFAAFILQQFARDEAGDSGSATLFDSAFDRNSVALQLSSLADRESSAACARATREMVAQVERSWVLA